MFSDIKDGVLQGGISIETDVAIPEGVIEIGCGAFAYLNSSCRSITIPDSVTSIGERAFLLCESLERITIPKYISKIGNNAFYSCYSLQYIKVADENTHFCDVDGVLYNAEKTELIRYPSSHSGDCYTIPDGAFQCCEKLKSVTIPKSVTKIGQCAFLFCSKLEKIDIPNGVGKIEYNAFGFCKNLVKISLPKKLKIIGQDAFVSCESLERVRLPRGVSELEVGAFSNCKSLKKVTLPKTLKKIGARAFCGCDALGPVKNPDSVTEIGANAFGIDDLAEYDMVKEDKYGVCKRRHITAIQIPREYRGSYGACDSL